MSAVFPKAWYFMSFINLCYVVSAKIARPLSFPLCFRRDLKRFESINWRAFLRVNSVKNMQVVINRIAKMIDQNVRIKSYEKYWKDQSLYLVNFESDLDAGNIKDAMFNTLLICGSIASHWTVTSPSSYTDDRWEFQGSSEKTSISGVEIIEFHIFNFK